MSTMGPWTDGQARLISAGGVDVSSGRKELKDVYGIVITDGSRPAAGVGGIPAYGDDHPDASVEGSPTKGLSVSNVSFSKPDETSNVWRAVVTYSAGGTNSDQGAEDTSKYTKLHIGTVVETRDLTVDANNPARKVVNSAGDPFECVPQVERHFLEVQLTRNQNTSPVSIIASCNGTVNSSALTVCGVSIPAKCGRISIEADRQFGAADRWSVSFRIVVNPDTWAVSVLENGYRYRDENGNLVKFTSVTEDGRVVECSSPQLLGPEGDGGDGRGRGPYYTSFDQYPEASWASLKLPSSL